jgi:hypothetical protein
MTGLVDAGAEARVDSRPWRNPFVVAFVLGALVLTILPFVQRRTLRAPPPLATLATWALPTLPPVEPAPADAARTASTALPMLGNAQLDGHVWLATVSREGCADCPAALAQLASMARHLDDLRQAVRLVAFVEPGASRPAPVAGAAAVDTTLVVDARGDDYQALRRTLEQGWTTQLERIGDRLVAFDARPSLVLIDQRGAVRGFWPPTDEGRGHAINAARMLSRQGAER